jgi:hypothetical protein
VSLDALPLAAPPPAAVPAPSHEPRLADTDVSPLAALASMHPTETPADVSPLETAPVAAPSPDEEIPALVPAASPLTSTSPTVAVAFVPPFVTEPVPRSAAAMPGTNAATSVAMMAARPIRVRVFRFTIVSFAVAFRPMRAAVSGL